jgi:hypothetical protein
MKTHTKELMKDIITGWIFLFLAFSIIWITVTKKTGILYEAVVALYYILFVSACLIILTIVAAKLGSEFRELANIGDSE